MGLGSCAIGARRAPMHCYIGAQPLYKVPQYRAAGPIYKGTGPLGPRLKCKFFLKKFIPFEGPGAPKIGAQPLYRGPNIGPEALYVRAIGPTIIGAQPLLIGAMSPWAIGP